MYTRGISAAGGGGKGRGDRAPREEAGDGEERNGVRGRFRVTEWGPFGVPELA